MSYTLSLPLSFFRRTKFTVPWGVYLVEFKEIKPGSVNVYDGPILIATIYAHEKHIAIVSFYLNNTKSNELVKANLVSQDLKKVPAVEIDFLI